jgi:tripartite-type tricarboxylate transporter receptor subunit TctC
MAGRAGTVKAVVLLVLVALLTPQAAAQEFPSRTVRIVVPFTPGGANDSVARAMADRLAKKWGKPVVVENRPGGGTTIGTRAVIDAAPDGHTLLFTSSSSLVVTPHTMNVNFDPLTDLAPIILAVNISPALAIGNHLPVKSVPELIALAKQSPGKLTFASAGTGTYTHVTMEYFTRVAGIEMLHVPYSGTTPVLTDLLGGRIDAYMVAVAVFKDLDRTGKLKIIAMGTEARHPELPNVPTIGETLPGFGVDVWFSFSEPARTPDAVLDKLHADMAEILSDKAFNDSFVRPQGFTLDMKSRAGFTAQVRRDHALWGKMVEAAGLKRKP